MASPNLSRRAFTAALAVGAGGLHGCAEITDRYGVRVDVQFLTPNGVIDIRFVRRLTEFRHYDWIPTANRYHHKVHGQAIPVDIGSRTLFLTKALYEATEDGEATRILVGSGIPRVPDDYPDWGAVPEDEVFELQVLQIPAIVVFDDPSNPWTIRLILPSELPQQIPGVRLGRCTARRSHAKATMSDVHKRLPWLEDRQIRTPALGDHFYADQQMFG